MIRKVFFSCLFLLGAVNGLSAQAVVPQGLPINAQGALTGTWTAGYRNGITLMGTWTAVPDADGEAVIGMWTVNDAQGTILGGGGWSAVKSPSGWAGAWRANVSGVKTEYSGTWSAAVDLKGSGRFANLFEKAVKEIVSGTWRRGGQTGGWSIRAQQTP